MVRQAGSIAPSRREDLVDPVLFFREDSSLCVIIDAEDCPRNYALSKCKIFGFSEVVLTIFSREYFYLGKGNGNKQA
jgi:hypothetical protein